MLKCGGVDGRARRGAVPPAAEPNQAIVLTMYSAVLPCRTSRPAHILISGGVYSCLFHTVITRASVTSSAFFLARFITEEKKHGFMTPSFESLKLSWNPKNVLAGEWTGRAPRLTSAEGPTIHSP